MFRYMAPICQSAHGPFQINGLSRGGKKKWHPEERICSLFSEDLEAIWTLSSEDSASLGIWSASFSFNREICSRTYSRSQLRLNVSGQLGQLGRD